MTKNQLKKELVKLNKTNFLNILKNCDNLNIDYEVICRDKDIFYVKYSYKNKHFYIKNDWLFHYTDKFSAGLVDNKALAKDILSTLNIKSPKGFVVKKFSEIKPGLKKYEINFPLVIKPNFTGKGLGVLANIKDYKSLEEAWKKISKIKNPRKKEEVIIEEYFHGKDYRLFVLKDKLIAAAERAYPQIKGNGKDTVKKLISRQNNITIDWEVRKNLKINNLTTQSILPKGKVIRIRDNANIATGGVCVNCTNLVASKFKKIAEQCSKEFGLHHAGIDILATDITDSKSDYRVIEVNHGPGFYIDKPDIGKPTKVIEKLLKEIFNIK